MILEKVSRLGSSTQSVRVDGRKTSPLLQGQGQDRDLLLRQMSYVVSPGDVKFGSQRAHTVVEEQVEQFRWRLTIIHLEENLRRISTPTSNVSHLIG